MEMHVEMENQFYESWQLRGGGGCEFEYYWERGFERAFKEPGMGCLCLSNPLNNKEENMEVSPY